MIENVEGNVVDISGDGWKVLAGSCLDRLKELEDNSIDAVVTDPPYELGFMGKSWDSSGIAFNVEVWAECLRVLKPGGHLLAFGGSRTWHRIAVAIEDAGFEVRDSIAWLYGSGFPKSLDVSKAIDKVNGEGNRLHKFTAWMRTTGITAKKLNEATSTAMGSHYLTAASQPAIPTPKLWAMIRPLIADVPAWVDELVERVEAEREVIGQKVTGAAMTGNTTDYSSTSFGSGQNLVDVTAPATPEAQKWQGWGTALKPAFEPVVVARKPLTGTVAGNVLEWGVGGLNIDGTRIASDDGFEKAWDKPVKTNISSGSQAFSPNTGTTHTVDLSANRPVGGRWPSNVMLDEFTAELVDQQSGISKSGKPGVRTSDGFNANAYGSGVGIRSGQENGEYGDSGGASRFFYVAKASKRDRNEGLDGLEETTAGDMVDRKENSAGMNSPRAGAGRTSGAKNFHPTVKPTDLMCQLVRLVTPLGGTVLDPFTGSGSTGKAAILEGMQFIGCELTEDYLPIIQGRIDWAVEQVKADKLKAEQEHAEVLF